MIRANATQLKSRLKQITEATRLAPYALSTVAVDTIGEVQSTALARLAGREDQVGFDLGQFIENIREPGNLEVSNNRGTIGILDQERMGTVEDFELIANIPGRDQKLWHQHGKRGDLFKREVFDYPAIREELAADRQSVWGTKTPQWYLMENGFSGGGEYPDVPAAHFIASSTRADRLTLKLFNAMNGLFKGISRR